MKGQFFIWAIGLISGISILDAHALPNGVTPVTASHPDHGASFLEQLVGQWLILEGDQVVKQLRCYEDGRFGFLSEGEWKAGSYVILRTDERSKGVLRLEYYVDGNLHLQEIRCEIHFTDGDQDHDDHGEEHHHGEDEEHGHDEGHHHEYMLVEVLPGAEQALDMAGDYLHRH